jgi:hypothetical protein
MNQKDDEGLKGGSGRSELRSLRVVSEEASATHHEDAGSAIGDSLRRVRVQTAEPVSPLKVTTTDSGSALGDRPSALRVRVESDERHLPRSLAGSPSSIGDQPPRIRIATTHEE